MVGILYVNNTIHEKSGDHFAMVDFFCVNDIVHEYSGDHLRDQLVPDQPDQPSGRLH